MDTDEEERVDINSASVEEFVTRLKGVGQSKAKAIVRFRTTVGKFKKLCELTDVPGITSQILQKNQHVLLCMSKQVRKITPLQENVINDVAGYSGQPILSSGDSGGEDNIDSSGQDEVRWKRNLNRTFSSNIQFNDNRSIGQLPSFDTPSTSSYNSEDTDCSSSSNTPIMRTGRNRSRSKNDERTFAMSTRSTPSSHMTRILVDTVSSSASPQRMARTRKVVDKPMTRRQNELLKNRTTNTPDQSTERDSGTEEDLAQNKTSVNMDFECTEDQAKHQVKPVTIRITAIDLGENVKRKRPRDLNGFQQMKRKFDQKSDSTKLQTPQKKACKSLRVTTDTVTSTASTSESSPKTSPSKLLPIKVNGLPEWLIQFQDWNSIERLAALDQLINVCEPHQVRHMLEVIEPQFQRDFISLLPKELALHVLSFLDPKDLLVAAQTCRYWHILAEDNILWREKCAEEGIPEPYYPNVCRNSKTKAVKNVQQSAWKSAFIRQHRIETNWRDGNHKSIKLLKGHDDHVITCLQFSGTRIVSGSDDNTLKVWSAITGKCLRTLVGHTGGVWASQMRKNMIISGSTDRTLKIWNADTGACMHTLYGHTSTVRCMALHDNIVVSGSRDATLRVWNIDTGNCLHVLSGHMAAVRCVCYDGKLVVSGAYDYNVKVWDPVKEECLHTLEGHTNRVYSLQFDGVHVVSGSLDTLIKVWSVKTGQCLHTLVGHQSLTSGMELKNNILVSGNADSTVKMWNIISGDCLKTLEGPQKHQSAVTCLQFSGKFVITSSDDGTVKLWDVETGKVIRNLVSLDSRGSGGVVWRIRASQTKLVCAVGSRNGTEETKLLVLDFDSDAK